MTFIALGLIGAALEGAALRSAEMPEWVVIAGTAHGFVGAILPDVADWVAWAVFRRPRWALYTRMHRGDFDLLSLVFPTYLTHIAIDTFFHDPAKPGWNWWPTLWWAELLGWILPGIALYLTFWR
jgi:hypothetical protein